MRSHNFDRVLASQWIRCLQVQSPLSHLGIQATVNARPSRQSVTVFLRRYDYSAVRAAQRLKSNGGTLVLDLVSDPFDLLGSRSHPKRGAQKQVDQTRKMLDIVDEVWCSSATLQHHLANFHPSAHYIPDGVNQTHFSKTGVPGSSSAKFVVWSGTVSKAQELISLAPILNELGLGLRMITDDITRANGLLSRSGFQSFQVLPWSYKTFPQLLSEALAFVAPRDLSHKSNLYPSNFKVAAPMAAGLPVVASAVPSYFEVLPKGAGFFVQSEAEFFGALRFLRDADADWFDMSSKARLNSATVSLEVATKKILERVLTLQENHGARPKGV